MSRQTGADDAGLTTRSRSIQVGEFEVAIPGGNWVAIGVSLQTTLQSKHCSLQYRALLTQRLLLAAEQMPSA